MCNNCEKGSCILDVGDGIEVHTLDDTFCPIGYAHVADWQPAKVISATPSQPTAEEFVEWLYGDLLCEGQADVAVDIKRKLKFFNERVK